MLTDSITHQYSIPYNKQEQRASNTSNGGFTSCACPAPQHISAAPIFYMCAWVRSYSVESRKTPENWSWNSMFCFFPEFGPILFANSGGGERGRKKHWDLGRQWTELISKLQCCCCWCGSYFCYCCSLMIMIATANQSDGVLIFGHTYNSIRISGFSLPPPPTLKS